MTSVNFACWKARVAWNRAGLSVGGFRGLRVPRVEGLGLRRLGLGSLQIVLGLRLGFLSANQVVSQRLGFMLSQLGQARRGLSVRGRTTGAKPRITYRAGFRVLSREFVRNQPHLGFQILGFSIYPSS